MKCEICRKKQAVAILRNGKFACKQCIPNENDVLRWLK